MSQAKTAKNKAAAAPITAGAESFRPARGLIGWIEADAGHQILVSGRLEATIDAEVVARAKSARQFAKTRKPVNQDGIVGNPPTGIGDHLAQLRQNAKNLFDEGWRICTVDLSRLYALQPTTFADYGESGVAEVTSDDTRSLANITLPLGVSVQMAISYDVPQRAWTVSSGNLNLQVIAPLEPNPSAPFSFGFNVAPSNSLLQVGRFGERYFCTDGHHRAYQLLRNGISNVPALVRDLNAYTELAPKQGLLPEPVLLGENPPTLSDFLDDQVSADILLPRSRKVVTITATEAEIPF